MYHQPSAQQTEAKSSSHVATALPRRGLDDPSSVGAAADLRYGSPLVVCAGRRQYLGVDPHDDDGHQHRAPAEHEAPFDEEMGRVLQRGEERVFFFSVHRIEDTDPMALPLVALSVCCLPPRRV